MTTPQHTEAQIAQAVKILRKAATHGGVSNAQIAKAQRILAASTTPVA